MAISDNPTRSASATTFWKVISGKAQPEKVVCMCQFSFVRAMSISVYFFFIWVFIISHLYGILVLKMEKTIYIFTPSWLIKKKPEYDKGVRTLEKLGFKILNKKHISKLPTNEEKIKEINRSFSDNKIDIILARRGGYSAIKILKGLDFSLIKKNPKIFAGFSDISGLINPIYEKTGLVTLHSPMVWNFEKPTNFTVKSFLNAINGFPKKNLFEHAPVKVFRHGKVQGRIKGGNLITLTSLIGTEWETQTRGAMLFLEEVDEKLYRIDRNMTQWILCGKFKGIKGLILGDFKGEKAKDVFKILSQQMKINFPVVHCPNIGHVKNKITIPIGRMAELDTRKGTLVLK
jgi:muramoyltetrapeptide carboxypeptidase